MLDSVVVRQRSALGGEPGHGKQSSRGRVSMTVTGITWCAASCFPTAIGKNGRHSNFLLRKRVVVDRLGVARVLEDDKHDVIEPPTRRRRAPQAGPWSIRRLVRAVQVFQACRAGRRDITPPNQHWQ